MLNLLSCCLMVMLRNCTSMSMSSLVGSGDSAWFAVADFTNSMDVGVDDGESISVISTGCSSETISFDSMLSMSTISSSFVASILIGDSGDGGLFTSTVIIVFASVSSDELCSGIGDAEPL